MKVRSGSYLDERPFYEAAVESIRTARAEGQLRLYLAKLHGVAERRPEPKPMGRWVEDFKNEVETCIREGWDVRIIERIEDAAHLARLVKSLEDFSLARHYLVKAAHGNEGLPFLNLLLVGRVSLLALDDPQFRLARMGLLLAESGQVQVLSSYWTDLWDRCPYWVRKASGLFDGAGGLSTISEQLGSSRHNPAFVAMWFGDSDSTETPDFMRSLYDESILPAIVGAGFKASRVDLVPHDGFIMNEVLSLIRCAPFVVADLTGHRNGVYYEAGFARACAGKPVIHTCRESDFVNSHFDVRQINTLMWSEPADLAKSLRKRIVEILGTGPFLKQS